MLTARLWRTLKRPPTRNPLFRRVYTRAEQPAPWYVGCVRWVGVLLFLPIIAFAGLIYGFGWSAGVATQLGRERESRRFDLISLTPPGPLGMSWAAALGYLYHLRVFRNNNDLTNLLVRSAFSALFLTGLALLFDMAVAFGAIGFAQLIMLWLTLVLALIVDHAQSVVVAILSGIVAAHAAGQRLSAQLYAFALYSGVQIMTYLVTLALGFALIPPIPGRDNSLLTLGLVLFRLILFVGTRELLIGLLWRWADRALEPDPVEQRILLGQPVRKVRA